MASGGGGGFKSSATTDFLEEWKAKREKMRAKMLGDIAAATGAGGGAATSGNCRLLEEPQHPAGRPKADSPERRAPDDDDCGGGGGDRESPPPGKSKEKKSSGPSARKGKGQIEKRKLREKRRSTGVVSMPSNESLDELDDDDGAEKDGRDEEEQLVLANTFQNESMTADPATGLVSDNLGRPVNIRPKCGGGTDEESRHRHSRHVRDAVPGSLEKRLEELEQELTRERQENDRLLKAHRDKDDLIDKLKEEMDLLYRDLDDIEDENEQLKQENKTLLKVVGQLTR
ncbi:PRKC apoptosis WT1 regulator protein [Syngnathoides biaculeatus]|uniref:PRKC apoptosis WT1 regulator protein n=1 Tax=Syngnathoides biaculeatus TaxID=300417 RepID=UPI002ADE175E|nr:PRKC apoptosis WT1 regulator protein [Syngnathoides biaculeatus]XP_061662220.1 PRKC apoptosis WT1 regulator protein [Syngnathoides biaculeatus]